MDAKEATALTHAECTEEECQDFVTHILSVIEKTAKEGYSSYSVYRHDITPMMRRKFDKAKQILEDAGFIVTTKTHSFLSNDALTNITMDVSWNGDAEVIAQQEKLQKCFHRLSFWQRVALILFG